MEKLKSSRGVRLIAGNPDKYPGIPVPFSDLRFQWFGR